MLASIHPLGERVRGNRFGITAAAFVVASTVAGALLGLALGAIGSVGSWLAGDAWWVVAALLMVVTGALALATDRGARGLRPLGPKRQVDEDWIEEYRGWVYGAGFGAQLGMGFSTIITTAAVHVTFLLALLVGSPIGGAAIGGAFGLVRGATLLAASRVRSPDQLRQLHRRMHELSPVAAGLALGAEAAVVLGGVVLVAVAL